MPRARQKKQKKLSRLAMLQPIFAMSFIHSRVNIVWVFSESKTVWIGELGVWTQVDSTWESTPNLQTTKYRGS